MAAARVRTIAGCIEQLRRDDPESALTVHALRSLVLSGKIPHVQVGAKRLVNLDHVYTHLTGNAAASVSDSTGAIRRVEV